MWQTSVSDSFDTETSHLKLISSSIRPKFITNIQRRLLFTSQQLPLLKSTQSYQILNNSTQHISKHQNLYKSSSSMKNDLVLCQKIRQNIETIKKSTIPDDKPVKLFQQFGKAKILAEISHQNKSSIRFIEICGKGSSKMLIQRNQWTQFSLFKGKGILVLPDGRKIKAHWYVSQPLGNCLITYPNESVYYGPVNQKLQKHGSGYMFFSNGQKLEGTFQDGKVCGDSVYFNKKGEVVRNSLFRDGLLMSSQKK